MLWAYFHMMYVCYAMHYTPHIQSTHIEYEYNNVNLLISIIQKKKKKRIEQFLFIGWCMENTYTYSVWIWTNSLLLCEFLQCFYLNKFGSDIKRKIRFVFYELVVLCIDNMIKCVVGCCEFLIILLVNFYHIIVGIHVVIKSYSFTQFLCIA